MHCFFVAGISGIEKVQNVKINSGSMLEFNLVCLEINFVAVSVYYYEWSREEESPFSRGELICRYLFKDRFKRFFK
jgi:hypothetical protein